jgi:hypothetical protein
VCRGTCRPATRRCRSGPSGRQSRCRSLLASRSPRRADPAARGLFHRALFRRRRFVPPDPRRTCRRYTSQSETTCHRPRRGRPGGWFGAATGPVSKPAISATAAMRLTDVMPLLSCCVRLPIFLLACGPVRPPDAVIPAAAQSGGTVFQKLRSAVPGPENVGLQWPMRIPAGPPGRSRPCPSSEMLPWPGTTSRCWRTRLCRHARASGRRRVVSRSWASSHSLACSARHNEMPWGSQAAASSWTAPAVPLSQT